MGCVRVEDIFRSKKNEHQLKAEEKINIPEGALEIP